MFILELQQTRATGSPAPPSPLSRSAGGAPDWDDLKLRRPPSTGASTVHNLVASASSLLESGMGGDLFLSAIGDEEFEGEPTEWEAAFAGNNLMQSMVGFDEDIAVRTTVCEIKLSCRHASVTLLMGQVVAWRETVPGSVDPWAHEPSVIFDCETAHGHFHLAAGNISLEMPGENDGSNPDWLSEFAVRVQRMRCDEYLSLERGGCAYGKASVSASQMGQDVSGYGSAMGMTQSVFLPGGRSFARNAILEVTLPPRTDGRKQVCF